MSLPPKHTTTGATAARRSAAGLVEAKVLHIPRNSFTALRLAYLSPRQIVQSSRCVFLGIVPHIWLVDESKGLLANIIKRAKGHVRLGFRDTLTMMNSGVKNRGRKSMNSFFNEESRVKAILEMIEEENDVSSDVESEDASCVSVRQHSLSLKPDNGGALLLRSYSPVPDDLTSKSDGESTEQSDVHTYRAPVHSAHDVPQIKLVSPDFRSSIPETPSHMQDSRSAASRLLAPDDEIAPTQVSESQAALHLSRSQTLEHFNRESIASRQNTNTLNVRFGSEVASSRHKLSIAIEKPEPLNEAPELFRIEKFHKRFNLKLKSLAKVSRGKARKTRADFRSRIHKSILRNFKAGEIIQETKALTLIKEAYKTSQAVILTEDETCDTRVLEYWREHFIVLRKAADKEYLVTFQVYKFNDKGRDDKPEYEIPIGPGVNAEFYNDADKSICLSVASNHQAMKFYILKFRTQSEAVRWLFFTKLLLQKLPNSYFHVSVPDLKLTVDVLVPEKIFVESFREMNDQEVGVLDEGYKVRTTPLLQYLKDVVTSSLYELDHGKWIDSLVRPWFCFRQYDRLEWVGDDSEIFYMKNQLFKSTFQLEMRDMIYQRDLMKGLEKPVPIEGFLARLSSMLGVELNLVRTFYKILYFYTCEDILFFAKYYKGIPPSPGNVLLLESEPNQNLTNILPMIYEHRCYDIDEKEHIRWLSDEQKFEEYDQNAFIEYERRAELMTKADCAIDLCTIENVVPVPFHDIKLQHKIYLSLLWYQKTNMIKDEEILDSCFEIITSNGGFIKLQAPNKKIRDEWVVRLLELRDYWVARRQADLNAMIKTRKSNLELLKINEYRDSNITHQVGLDEMKRSVAQPTGSITHITLETPLLHSGYLYQKFKKHADFNQYFVTLTTGNLTLYSLFKRSKMTGEWKRGVYYKHFLSLPLDECYIYSGYQTEIDLLDRDADNEQGELFNKALPRIYIDGWKSQEEEPMRCFTVWFGKKRAINKTSTDQPKNPNIMKLALKLGVTGLSVVFMARSRQERELWVSSIIAEIDRFTAINRSLQS